MTARDIINGSLRLIGVLSSGETATADEQNDALLVLNEILDTWSINGYFNNTPTREVFSLIPSQGKYTIGIGADLNTIAPISIEQAKLKVGSTEYDLEDLLDSEWASIPDKTIQSEYVAKFYYAKTLPVHEINLYPIPLSAYELVLYSYKSLPKFSSINDDLIFPTNYTKALRYNLALELAPEYGKAISPVIAAAANESISQIARINTKIPKMVSDATLTSKHGNFDIIRGY